MRRGRAYLVELLVEEVAKREDVRFVGVVGNDLGELWHFSVSPDVAEHVRRHPWGELHGEPEVDVVVSHWPIGSGERRYPCMLSGV